MGAEHGGEHEHARRLARATLGVDDHDCAGPVDAALDARDVLALAQLGHARPERDEPSSHAAHVRAPALGGGSVELLGAASEEVLERWQRSCRGCARRYGRRHRVNRHCRSLLKDWHAHCGLHRGCAVDGALFDAPVRVHEDAVASSRLVDDGLERATEILGVSAQHLEHERASAGLVEVAADADRARDVDLNVAGLLHGGRGLRPARIRVRAHGYSS